MNINSEYKPLAANEAEEIHLAVAESSSSNPAPESPTIEIQQSTKKIFITSNDSVFANMAAKPQLEVEDDSEKPPEYASIADDRAPAYMENTVYTNDSGEILVDGMPVGSPFVFVITAMISMAFQMIGFIAAYFLSVTHAGRCGARVGWGITLINFGIFVRSKAFLEQLDQDDAIYFARTGEEPETRSRELFFWFAYIVLFLGWFIVIRSVGDFIRARRIQAIIESTPSTITVRV